MTETTVSKVKLPSGEVVSIRHPVGATDQQIFKFAKQQGPVEYKFEETSKNAWPSARRAVGDMVNAAMSPIDTAGGLGRTAIGAAQKIPGGLQVLEPLGVEDNRAYPDAMWNNMKERYGSWDNIKRTAMEDPAGMALEFLGGLGQLPGKVGMMARAADPVNAAINTTKAGIKTLPNVENALLQKVNKFSTTLDPDQSYRMTETQLNEGIMPTRKGLDKLESLINDEMVKLDDMLVKANNEGRTVSKAQLLSSLQELKKTMSATTTPQYKQRVKEIDAIIEGYADQWQGINQINPVDALAMKRSLDRQINWKSVRQKGTMGQEEADVALRSGIRKELETVDPRVSEVNDRAASLLELQQRGSADGVERTMRRLSNNNALPLRSVIAAGTGVASGNPAGVAAGMTAATGMLPIPQAAVALFIRNVKNTPLADVYLDGNGKLTQAGRLALMEIERVEQEQRANRARSRSPQ